MYVLGEDMCRTIADALGQRRLVDLFTSPERTLLTYNDAAQMLGDPLLASDVVAAVAGLGAQ